MTEPTSLLTRGQFDRIAKALADPRRFALLQAIASDHDYPCSQLCRDFPVTKATISHHLKELVRAGLVQADRQGQFMNYRVRREVLAAYSAELLTRLSPRSLAVETSAE
ncbi:MAG TPA: metalloregulator ArsR/SmtB family transcription factor [Gemmatimonadales bacterium]